MNDNPRSQIASFEKSTNKLKDIHVDFQVLLEDKADVVIETKVTEMGKMVDTLVDTAEKAKICCAKVKAYLKAVGQNKKAASTKNVLGEKL